MEPLIVLAVTFVLLWVIFILPQQRRVRAHQALVASIQPGDQVILSAGIYGRIVELGPEDMALEVAPGVELRVARQAVLRLSEDATSRGSDGPATPTDDATTPRAEGMPPTGDDRRADPAEGDTEPDDRGPSAPGPNVT